MSLANTDFVETIVELRAAFRFLQIALNVHYHVYYASQKHEIMRLV